MMPVSTGYLGIGYGGGGELRIDTYGNTGLYLKTRELDDSFTVPAPVWPEDLGDNAVLISDNTLVEVFEDDILETGDLYLLEGYGGYLYQYVSGKPWDYANIATGLKVAAGAILTLELNSCWVTVGYGGYYQEVSLDFEDDVVIDGTVRTDVLDIPENSDDRDKGALSIRTWGHITTGAGSLIDTAGDDAVDLGDQGGYGGAISLDAGAGIVLAGEIDASGGDGYGGFGGHAARGYCRSDGVSIYSEHSSIINRGPIYASGGDGVYDSIPDQVAYGGSGAPIRMESGFELYNRGNLYADGGNGDNSPGGNAGGIELHSYGSALYNSGDCYARGGDGDASFMGSRGGGLGGVIRLKGADKGAGNLVNSGDLTVDSGDALNEGSGGGFDLKTIEDNGDGSFEIIIKTLGGDLLSTGALSANGGDATGAGQYYGGSGGKVTVEVIDGEDLSGIRDDNDVASGLCQVTGDISANGGDGPAGGGSGGKLVIRDDYDGSVIPPPVKPNELLGYALVDLTGGDSAGFAAGHGGRVKAETADAVYADIYYPTGALANRVAIDASGGDGTMPALGGNGGSVEFEAEGDAYVGTTVALNSGAIDISGGDGYGGGWFDNVDVNQSYRAGYGGEFFLYGHDYAENTGAINASGGLNRADADEEDFGWTWVSAGDGGFIGIASAFDALNTGDVVAVGGAATGEPYEMVIPQQPNGVAPFGHVFGGYGGWMELNGVASTTNSGDVDLSGGASTNDIGGEGGAALIGTANSIEGASVNSGTITVVGGLGGDENGPDGFIWIDGFEITPSDGTLP